MQTKRLIRTTIVLALTLAMSGAAAQASTSVYQHNQTDLEFLALSPQGPGSEGFWLGSNDALAAGVQDGTSNTVAFGERAAAPRGFSIDIATSENIAADGLGADYILMPDMGGRFHSEHRPGPAVEDRP